MRAGTREKGNRDWRQLVTRLVLSVLLLLIVVAGLNVYSAFNTVTITPVVDENALRAELQSDYGMEIDDDTPLTLNGMRFELLGDATGDAGAAIAEKIAELEGEGWNRVDENRLNDVQLPMGGGQVYLMQREDEMRILASFDWMPRPLMCVLPSVMDFSTAPLFATADDEWLDVPGGRDLPDVPRPEGARRLLSLQVGGNELVSYQVKLENATNVLERTAQELSQLGWMPYIGLPESMMQVLRRGTALCWLWSVEDPDHEWYLLNALRLVKVGGG